MNDETNALPDEIQEDELTALKARADHMGISYHTNIGVEKLKERISAKQADMIEYAPIVPAVLPVQNDENSRRLESRKRQNELVRLRVTCMNPNKRQWEGEIFTTGNSQIGTFRKYVPFGVEYHVPRIIHTMIEERQCQAFFTVTDPVTRRKVTKGRLIKEFAVEVLDNLTPQELKDLAQRQAIAQGTPA